MRLILLLAVTFTGLLARPEHHGHRRSDIQDIKRRNMELPQTREGECPPMWTDASSVGLGCILIDINDMGTDEVHAEELCASFEGGRLLEIYTGDQMSFLQTLLTDKEEQLGITDGFIWYWLGLNDIAEEGQWVWPSGAAAEFTYWDEEMEEPYPDPDHERNCAMMQSAQFNLMWGTYWCDDGYDMVPMCQIL